MGIRDRLGPDFWDAVDKLDAAKEKFGLPGPRLRPILEEFSLIDSDALRRAAEHAWGTGGESAGMPGNLAAEMGVEVQRLVGAVAERWHGAAFDRFQSTATSFGGLLPKLVAPCQEVGQRLTEVADSFELTRLEIIGWLATGGAVAATLLAAMTPLPAVDEGLMAAATLAIGTIATLISVWVTYVGSTSRFDTLDAAVAEIEEMIKNKLPRIDATPVPALPGGEWVRDSADPTS
ncbi:MAG: hypothetical protein HOY78_18190 [Saccharothrix sp.]|nr:hypothetical protein [Saccharothrix sp.]